MIRNSVLLSGVLLALVGCSSDEAVPASPAAQAATPAKPVPAPRASLPADASRRYRLSVSHVTASGLTREQAVALLEAAGVSGDKSFMDGVGLIADSGGSAKIRVVGVPTIALGEGREGVIRCGQTANPDSALSLRATASAPYADGEVPVALRVEDAGSKYDLAVSLTPGRPLLVSESGVPVDAALRPHSPLIMHIVAELDCRADFLRVELAPEPVVPKVK